MRTRTFFGCTAAVTIGLASAMAIAASEPGSPTSSRPLPRWLSDTGLYSDVATWTVDPRHLPFSPQYPLWTDGADKRRWVSLPAGSPIDISNLDAWTFPVGTRFWKEFAFGGRRVETRMLVKVSAADWEFASYAWNASQTDAELVPAGGLPGVAEVAPGRRHSIPSIEDCRACHDSKRTEVLGFTALQLSDDRDPGAPHGEPLAAGAATLRTLAASGLLHPARPELVSTPPRIPAASPATRAVLGYLSTNCGSCHNRESSIASLGLTFRQPAYGGGFDVVRDGLVRRTKWDRPGAPPETTTVVDHQAPEQSALLLRMKSRRPVSQMPPLGTVVPDQTAIRTVEKWVRELAIED